MKLSDTMRGAIADAKWVESRNTWRATGRKSTVAALHRRGLTDANGYLTDNGKGVRVEIGTEDDGTVAVVEPVKADPTFGGELCTWPSGVHNYVDGRCTRSRSCPPEPVAAAVATTEDPKRVTMGDAIYVGPVTHPKAMDRGIQLANRRARIMKVAERTGLTRTEVSRAVDRLLSPQGISDDVERFRILDNEAQRQETAGEPTDDSVIGQLRGLLRL